MRCVYFFIYSLPKIRIQFTAHPSIHNFRLSIAASIKSCFCDISSMIDKMCAVTSTHLLCRVSIVTTSDNMLGKTASKSFSRESSHLTSLACPVLGSNIILYVPGFPDIPNAPTLMIVETFSVSFLCFYWLSRILPEKLNRSRT
jgi:hypothetical protein